MLGDKSWGYIPKEGPVLGLFVRKRREHLVNAFARTGVIVVADRDRTKLGAKVMVQFFRTGSFTQFHGKAEEVLCGRLELTGVSRMAAAGISWPEALERFGPEWGLWEWGDLDRAVDEVVEKRSALSPRNVSI